MGKRDKLIRHNRLPIVYNPFSRRLFLQGASGIVLLPFLESLLPRIAWGQTSGDNFKKAVFLVNRHGGHWLDAEPTGVNYQTVAPNVLAGSLKGSGVKLGPIYNQAYNDLKDKLTVIRGLDCMAAWGHIYASALAASHVMVRTDADGSPALNEISSAFPETIDVVLSKSNKVYPTAPPLRVLRLSTNESKGKTHCFENHRILQSLGDYNSVRDFVQSKIIQTPEPADVPREISSQEVQNTQRRKIFENALLLINETKKKSKVAGQDKEVLDQYLGLIQGLRDDIPEGPVDEEMPPVSSFECKDVGSTSDVQAQKMADLMVAALACGVTKLGYMSLPGEHYYVHRVHTATNRELHKNFLRDKALAVGSYLMKKMDSVIEANGKTMLDNSCVMVTSDLGCSQFDNHNGLNMRVLVGGSLNGALTTGQAIDYQNRNHLMVQKSSSGVLEKGDGLSKNMYAGRAYNELLISILRGFGLSSSDYQRDGKSGFGTYECFSPTTCNLYETKFNDQTQEKLNQYMRSVYLKNYNRNSTLPYFYKG